MNTTEKVTLRPVINPRYSFIVRWPGSDGKRRQRYFTNETEAQAEVKKRKAELGEVGEAFGSLSEPERGAVSFWRSFVASVPEAPPPDLLDVLKEYAEQWKESRSSVTVAAAMDSYEAAKFAEGLRPLSLQSIRTRCGRFVADFGERPISSITSAEISDWILGLRASRTRASGGGGGRPAKQKGEAFPHLSLQAKRNHRLAIHGLFNFAKARGWVRENPVTDAARPRVQKTRPGILRPSDVARLFAALESVVCEIVPFWAVRFFAGIREQEALRMDWGMIDFRAGEIHLPDTITKTGYPRTVKIEPALAAFLEPHARPDGPVCPYSDMSRRYRLGKALAKLQAEDAEAGKEARPFPVPMPSNAARHSFATYHLLHFRHAGETALQLGHGGSPELLHRHYKGIASEAEAKAFWKIRPAKKPTNVVPLRKKTAKAGPKKAAKRKKAR